jgi:hemerythrin
MSTIQWRPEYATGIADVDHEHQELIEWIRRALIASDPGGAAEAPLDNLLGEIYAKISAHFALEERVMKSRAYDQFIEHKRDHDRLLDDIRDIMDEVAAGTDLPAGRFESRLNDWFGVHFSSFDARFHQALPSG